MSNKIKIIFLFICLFLLTSNLHSQQEVPWWWTQQAELLKLSKNCNFEYIPGMGEGSDETDARKKAEAEAYRMATARIRGVTFQETTYKEIEKNGLDATLREYRTLYTIVCNTVSQPSANGKWKVYILFAWQKDDRIDANFYEVDASICNSRMTTQYPISYRVLIPGVAQIHKGSKTKASLIITSELISIGGIIASYALPSYYDRKFYQTHDYNKKKDYLNKIDFCEKPLRYASWSLAGAIYLYSLFDGWFAPGKPYFNSGNTSLHLYPYALPDENGIILSLIF